MAAATDLAFILRKLNPRLTEERWVFCVVPAVPAGLPHPPLMIFREREGVTLIVRKDAAASLGVSAAPEYRQIILTVHSSLEAVGVTAAVSSVLARAGIACNVVAAFHHDHLFVPQADAERALGLLQALSLHAD